MTIRHEIVVTLGGTPVGKGSLKCVGRRGARNHVLIEDNPRTEAWRTEVCRAVRAAISVEDMTAEKGEPVGVEITTTLPRPAGHYGTGRNASALRTAAPEFPTAHGTGDVDKLARLILDALQDSGIVEDDAQIVEILSRKVFLDGPGLFPDVLAYSGVRLRIYPIVPPFDDGSEPPWT